MKLNRAFSAATLVVPAVLVGSAGLAAAGHIPGRSIDARGRTVQAVCPAELQAKGSARCFSHKILSFRPTPGLLDEAEPMKRDGGTGGKDAGGGGTTTCDETQMQFATLQPWMLVGTEIQKLYNLSGVGTVSGNAPIIALVDAYGYSGAYSDLTTYRSQAGLPPLPKCTTTLPSTTACFAQVSDTGSTTLPADNAGWDGEQALDLQMASSACPACSIVLVDATDSGTSLNTAVNYAATIPGVVAISNSYGGGEGGDTSDTTYNHPGVLVAAASGDGDYLDEGTASGGDTPATPNYPASSPYVLAVGGTTPRPDTTVARGFDEVVWNWGMQPTGTGTATSAAGTGSGCSTEFPKPSWQTASTGSCSMRATNDVSAAGDWNSMIPVLNDAGVAETDDAGNPYYYGGIGVYQAGCWSPVGGTSAATPLVSAIFARLGLAATVGAANGQGVVYQNQSYFFDIVKGTNDESGTCTDVMCTAGTGWDGPTGMGTPNGVAIALALGVAVTDAGYTPPVDSGVVGATDAGHTAADASMPDGGGHGGHDGGGGGGGGYDASGGGGTVDAGGGGGGGTDSGINGSDPDAGSGGGGGNGDNGGGGANSGGGCDMSGGSSSAPGVAAGLLLGLVAFVSRRRNGGK